MKICVVQTHPVKGDVASNIQNHLRFIRTAISKNARLIMFPELSLTGYEPELAKDLATNAEDERLNVFQDMSNANNIIIAVGIPTLEVETIRISMIIFQPNQARLTYSKQYLYPTEVGYFLPGHRQVYLDLGEGNIAAPAICYELSAPAHSENAQRNNANIYMASVLNSLSGVDNDIEKLSQIARKYKMTTFMANYVGQSGGYQCAGKTSVWNDQGELIGQLNGKDEGLLMFDTATGEVSQEYL